MTTYPALIAHEHCLLVPSATEPQKKPSNASVMTMSPDGKLAMAQINNEVYYATIPMAGGEVPSINVSNPGNAIFPAAKLTELGGEFPHWSGDGSKVHWSLGSSFFSYDIEEGKRVTKELKKKKEKEAEAKKEKKEDAKDEDGDENGEEGSSDEGAEEKSDSESEEKGEEEEKDEAYKAHELKVKVMVPRDIPQGEVVLTNARLITMKGGRGDRKWIYPYSQ